MDYVPILDDHVELGDDSYLEMIRNISFLPSDMNSLRSKAVLLMSILELVETEVILNNQIVPDICLKMLFERNWNNLRPGRSRVTFESTFIQMDDDRFWDRKYRLSTSPKGHSVIESVSYAILDVKLFKAMQDEISRDKLKIILKDRINVPN